MLHGQKWQTVIEAHVDVKITDGYLLVCFLLTLLKKKKKKKKKKKNKRKKENETIRFRRTLMLSFDRSTKPKR